MFFAVSISSKWRNTFRYFAVFILVSLAIACTRTSKQSGDPHDVTRLVSADPSVRILTPGEAQRFYSWLAREMYEQVYGKKMFSTQALGGWSNVLIQGGAVEGVYHGMILSREYRVLEVGRASIAAARFFAEEIAFLATEENKLDEPGRAIAQKLAEKAMNAPLFTLKRQLGERILQEIGKRKDNRRQLSEFYARTVTRWLDKGVEFGLKRRNIAEEEFHRDWAMSNSLGLLQWEMLNRMHRIFNQFGGIILGGS